MSSKCPIFAEGEHFRFTRFKMCAIGLSIKDLDDLRSASLLHDIGKVGIPDGILNKPGPLSEEEWILMKKHSAEGAKIVSHIGELAKLVPVIAHHHEKYDGSGYPDGLKGEAIPVGARIISIADAYDTMTTVRRYKKAISHEAALEEILKYAGTQFDPELAEVLCRAMERKTRVMI